MDAIQTILLDMRREQREDHQTLVKKVDAGFGGVHTRINDHEVKDVEEFTEIAGRLKTLEEARSEIRWLFGILVSAFLVGGVTFIWDFVKHHVN